MTGVRSITPTRAASKHGVAALWLGRALAAAAGLAPGIATAQTSSLLLPPATTSGDDYDRGHNVGVVERGRPEYDALGVRLGSFIVNPQLTTSIGYSDNIFNDNSNKKSDVYTSFEPYVSVASDWSVHQLRLTGVADIRRFANETLRNQDAWNVQGSGRVDVTRALTVRLDAQADRTYESPFSADVVANLIEPSRYLRTFVGTRTSYDSGRSRVIGTIDRTSYEFSSVRFADGLVRDQRYRDRVTYNGTGTYELGFSPSLSLYARLEADRNNYGLKQAFGEPNRDSNGYRGVFGSNFDIAGVARGTIGIGYSYRKFDASQTYRTTSGMSVEARADWFPSELTTVGILLQRRLIDVDLSNAGSSWDNRFRVTVDHELLYNLIVTIGGEVSKREYPERSTSTQVYRAEVGSRYQVTRWLGLDANIGYGSNKPSGVGLGNPFDELRARFSIRIRR
ncbi:outer membrane beta-barrel protein [Sphingomonas sp. ZB1N12]|uniref:outer membrane beta-barrel protein n=1 Tax=Sphingomonas arabinosi TaxID=3096160 RepID=UPI002FCB2D2E